MEEKTRRCRRKKKIIPLKKAVGKSERWRRRNEISFKRDKRVKMKSKATEKENKRETD